MALYKYGKMPKFLNLLQGCGLERLCSNSINLRRHHVKNCFNNICRTAAAGSESYGLRGLQLQDCQHVNLHSLAWMGSITVIFERRHC